MKFKEYQRISHLILVLLLILNALSGVIRIGTINAQTLSDNSVIALTEEKNGSTIQWTMAVNQGATIQKDQLLEFVLDGKYETLGRVEYLTPEGSYEVIEVTQDRTLYDQRIQTYQNYLASVSSYQKDLKDYQDAQAKYQVEVANYQENLRLYNEVLLAYQAAVAQYETDYQAYQSSLESYTSQGLTPPADLVEPQLPSEYQVAPEAPTEPVAPQEWDANRKDPTDPILEQSWKLVYQEPHTQTYTLLLPEKVGSATLKWTTDRQATISENYQIQAFNSFVQDGQTITYESQTKVVANTSTNSDMTSMNGSVVDSSGTATTTTIDETNQQKITLNDPIQVLLGETLDYAMVIKNFADLPKDWTYQWQEKPVTDTVGQHTAILIVTKGTTGQEQVNINYEVTEPMMSMMRSLTTFAVTPAPWFKLVGDSGQVLAGAQFQVLDSNGNVIQTVTSDSQGMVTLPGLSSGDYSIKQITKSTTLSKLAMSPNQLKLTIFPDNTYSLTGGSDYDPTTQVLTNYIGSQIAVKLRSVEDNRVLVGGSFTLWYNGQAIMTSPANSSGMILFSNLQPGTYYIEQTKVGYDPTNPSNTYKYDYHTDTSGKHNQYGPITVDATGSVTYSSVSRTIYNRLATPGVINFQVKDAYTGKLLPGAKFRVYKKTELATVYELVGDVTSNANGIVRVANDVPGLEGKVTYARNYYFEPLDSPTGYKLMAPLGTKLASVGIKLASWDVVFYDQMREQMYLQPLVTNFTFTKMDRHTNQALSGAKFSLRKISNTAGGVTVDTLPVFTGQTVSSATNGQVTFKNLTYGTYELYEVSAPNGYSTLPYTIRFEVTDTGADSLKITNVTTSTGTINPNEIVVSNNQLTQVYDQRVTDLNFKKVGQQSILNAPQKPISDVSFELTKVNDPAIVQTATSDSLGDVRFNNLPVGSYMLKEASQLPGYYKEDQILTYFDVVYNPDSGTLNKTNFYSVLASDPNTKLPSHLVRDPSSGQYSYLNQRESYAFVVVDDQGKPISGAQFQVTNLTNPSDPPLIKTSDVNGRVTLNRTASKPNSEFIIKQLSTQTGLQIEETEWQIKVDAYGQVTMIAPSGDNDFISGTVVEPQNGTILDSTNHFTLINRPLTYDFAFIKTGLNDIGLPGAEFSLTPMVQGTDGTMFPDPAGTILKATSSSDASNQGQVTFADLAPGYYKFEETVVPNGYEAKSGAYQYIQIVLDPAKNQLVFNKIQNPEGNLLVRNTTTGNYSVPNSLITDYQFKSYGYDAKGTIVDPFKEPVIPLAGVKYELKGTGTLSDYLQVVTSSATGSFGFSDVKPGTYQLRQLEVPGTHLLSDAVYEINLTVDTTGALKMTYSRISGTSDFIAQNSTGQYLAINPENPAVIQFRKVADNNEGLSINEMPPLEGATFQVFLYDSTLEQGYDSTKPLQTQTSNAEGLIQFEDLAAGHIYKVVEKSSSLNYQMPALQSARVDISATGQVTWLQDSIKPADAWSFNASDGITRTKNNLHLLQLSFLKEDDNTKSLAGAEFTITEYSDSTYQTPLNNWKAVSGPDGRVTFDFGNYLPSASRDDNNQSHFMVTESKVPDGYSINIPSLRLYLDSQNQFHVNADDQSQFETSIHLRGTDYVITNNQLKTELAFTKIDGFYPTRWLTGASFQLESIEKDAQGQPLYSKIVSNLEGSNFLFTDLTLGQYTLTELSPPVGYISFKDQPINIIVKEKLNDQGQRIGDLEVQFDTSQKALIERMDIDGDGTSTLVVKNYPLFEFPQTGGPGSLIYLFCGLGLMLLSLIFYHRLARNEPPMKGGG